MNSQDKLRVKFGIVAQHASAILAQPESIGGLIDTAIVLDVVTDDPDDNRVLECAVAGRADYIVSGDRHLLNLKAHASIPILTARQFLDAIAPPSGNT